LAVVGYINRWLVSMSLTFRLCSSIGLSPVSLLILSFIDSILPVPAINVSIFCVVGIFIAFASFLYGGICHSIL